MGKYKAIVADLDDTLIRKGEKIMPKGRAALKELHERGVLIGAATGRPVGENLFSRTKEWGLDFGWDFIIGMNGGEYWENTDGVLNRLYLLQPDSIKEILEILAPFDVEIVMYEDGYASVLVNKMTDKRKASQKRNNSNLVVADFDRMTQNPTGKIEVIYKPEEEAKLMETLANHPSDKYISVITFTNTVEFVDSHVNKGLGVDVFLEKHPDIKREEILAFGDRENDIDMFKASGHSVCLLNGSEAAKAAADEITEFDVDNDGVGNYLYSYVID